MRFATCSFPEYRPEQHGGIPVRTSNGFPRYKLRYTLTRRMPSTFPAWPLVTGNLDAGEFTRQYRAQLDGTGIDAVLAEARAIQRAEGADDGALLVLLCFEQLAKKSFCHRTVLASWLDEHAFDVTELGQQPAPDVDIPLF